MMSRFLVLCPFVGGAAGVFFPGQDYVCDGLNASSAEIDVVCPSVVAGSANVTVVDCEDAARLILGKAESLLGCAGSSSTPPASQAAKDAACVFMRREEVNSTAMMKSFCNHFGSMLSEPCTSLLQTAWTDVEASCDDMNGALATPHSSSPALTTGLAFPGQDTVCEIFSNSSNTSADLCYDFPTEGFTAKCCKQAMKIVVRKSQRAARCPGYFSKNSTEPAFGREVRRKACRFVMGVLENDLDVTGGLLDQICPSSSSTYQTCTHILVDAWLDYVDACKDNANVTTTVADTMIV